MVVPKRMSWPKRGVYFFSRTRREPDGYRRRPEHRPGWNTRPQVRFGNEALDATNSRKYATLAGNVGGSEWGSKAPANVYSTRYSATDGSFGHRKQCKAVFTAGEWQVDFSTSPKHHRSFSY